eukprot:2100319-Pyramimonas_sp.AAC.1
MLQGWEPDVISHSTVISACDRCAQWQPALALLSAMRPPLPPPDAYAFNSTISACGRAGRWELSVELLGRMRRESVLPDV